MKVEAQDIAFFIGQLESALGGVHTIALGQCEMGNNMAASRATKMISHFPNLEHIIMCGIAGGIPSPENPQKHVRLGDIVVSEGVVQYDMISDTVDGIRLKSTPPRPSAALIEADRRLQIDEYSDLYMWRDYIDKCAKGRFKKPDARLDILHDALGEALPHPNDDTIGYYPKIYHGVIGSANTLLRNPQKRQWIKNTFGAFAFEMEGSGIADAAWDSDVGYIVIRGICDYGDSYKNDIWQEYASLVAAAYSRALIEKLPS